MYYLPRPLILFKTINATCSHSLPRSISKQRLETKYASNPTRFNYLYTLVQVEIETNTTKSSSSCTNGLLWLTR